MYMAPEVFKGDKYENKVDMWSLGVIVYQMITFEMPFPKEGDISDENFQYKPLPSNVHPFLVKLVQRLLVRDVSRRLFTKEALSLISNEIMQGNF